MIKQILIFACLLSVSSVSKAQSNEEELVKEVNQTFELGEYVFREGQRTNIRNPFELRDPFRRDVPTEQKSISDIIRSSTEFSNLPSIDGVPVENIRITGVILGENRRAIARVSRGAGGGRGGRGGDNLSAESFIIKEGMRLGEYDAEVKAILPGGVVLVEQILNVYNQVEYIETILPVRPDR